MLEQFKHKGGNAANSAGVLGELGEAAVLFSMLGTGPDTEYASRDGGDASIRAGALIAVIRHRLWISRSFVVADLASMGVSTTPCVAIDGAQLPTSYIIVSQATGSRTIAHLRQLRELEYADFVERIYVRDYAWVHFEARERCRAEIFRMMEAVRETNASVAAAGGHRIRVSVELEQEQLPEFERFAQLADVVRLRWRRGTGAAPVRASSRATADLPQPRVRAVHGRPHGRGRAAICAALRARRVRRARAAGRSPPFPRALSRWRYGACRSAILICAWGTYGADGLDADGRLHHSGSFPPERVVDSVGAGDTFIAGCIYSLKAGGSVAQALEFGCRVAGKKVGQAGFRGLARGL